MRSQKLRGFDSIIFRFPVNDSIDLFAPLLYKSHHYTRYHYVGYCQRYQRFPSQIHQLVIAETRQGPAHPHEKEDEKKYFNEQRDDTQYRNPILAQTQTMHEWEIVSTEVKRRHYCRRYKHVNIFGEKKKAQFHG